MNQAELTANLAAVCTALNQIEVKGKANLAYLAGCINTLEGVLSGLETPAPAEEGSETD